MSLLEIADHVAQSLRCSTGLLQKLHEGLVHRRTAWISARPSSLDEPSRALDDTAQQLQAEDARRRELLDAARQALPPITGAAGERHVNVSTLAAQLPPVSAARLQRASAMATDAARRVRAELALGERLLRFSQRAHEHLLAGVSESLTEVALDVGSYDRSARRVNRALPTASAMPGSLIDGRI